MAHDTHHAGGPHPELPPVQDEAADSPIWLPVTGLALLAVLAFFVLLRGAQGAGDAPAEGEVAAEAAEAPADAPAAD